MAPGKSVIAMTRGAGKSFQAVTSRLALPPGSLPRRALPAGRQQRLLPPPESYGFTHAPGTSSAERAFTFASAKNWRQRPVGQQRLLPAPVQRLAKKAAGRAARNFFDKGGLRLAVTARRLARTKISKAVGVEEIGRGVARWAMHNPRSAVVTAGIVGYEALSALLPGDQKFSPF